MTINDDKTYGRPDRNSRRAFLRLAGAAAAAQMFPWSWTEALAQTQTNEDYKALVCVFLLGGNDGNNLIVPLDASSYAGYSAVRGVLALPQSGLSPLSPPSQGGRSFGLHPALSDLAPLWQQGKLAVQCNVGPLIAPITVAEYKSNRSLRPDSLFSHSDQQAQWQTSESAQISRTGWGGRIADRLASASGTPMILSLSGKSPFSAGAVTAPLVLPATGTFGLTGSASNASAVQSLLALDRGNSLVDAASGIMQQAISSAAIVNPVLNGSSSAAMAGFSGVTNSTARQLLAVAKLIESRRVIGGSRQIFFVSQGGYDTHSNQLVTQNRLLAELGPALAAFYKATEALGIADKVTAFTASDFARTLRPASGGGTDHAWGNHQLVLGGSVRGGEFYGRFPTLALNGPDDVDGSGRWLPTTSVDQYAATFAKWFGVAPSDLPVVLPNLSRFQASSLGFLG